VLGSGRAFSQAFMPLTHTVPGFKLGPDLPREQPMIKRNRSYPHTQTTRKKGIGDVDTKGVVEGSLRKKEHVTRVKAALCA